MGQFNGPLHVITGCRPQKKCLHFVRVNVVIVAQLDLVLYSKIKLLHTQTVNVEWPYDLTMVSAHLTLVNI